MKRFKKVFWHLVWMLRQRVVTGAEKRECFRILKRANSVPGSEYESFNYCHFIKNEKDSCKGCTRCVRESFLDKLSKEIVWVPKAGAV